MVKDFEDRCVFDELKEFYYNNNGELYSYQDFEKSGVKEFNMSSHKINDLKVYEKNRLAADFIRIFLDIAQDKEEITVLDGYVTLNPVINYYENLEKLFKCIYEYENNKIYIENLIYKIITKSNSKELIKGALIGAYIIKINNIEEILKIYEIHNEYLFYVLNGYEHIGLSNNEFFEIAKKSKGYGKFFSILHLKPVNYEISDWMIEEGCNNNVAITELVCLSMLSIDILDYMNKTTFSKEKIENLSKSFSIMFSDYGVKEIRDEVSVCEKLLEEINENAADIYSLYVTISILYSLEADLIDYYKEKKINLQISLYNKYKNIIDMCKKICKKEHWKTVVENELTNIELETSILITCAEKIGYKIKKKDFEILFKRDYENALLYKYAFSVGNKNIKKCAYNIAMKNLSVSELSSGPGEFTIDKLKYEDIQHVCFFIMSKYMNYEDFADEYKEFNLRAIKSPLIETRIQASSNLEKFKGKFDLKEIEYIKNSIISESVSSVRRALNSLLADDYKREKKTVNVDNFSDMTIHVKDIYLISVNIENNNTYDCSELFNKLKEDDMVYLIRDSDNLDNSNVILVTTDKGLVIGTIPINLGEIIKNLIDNGKYFYGIVEKISDNYEEISIGVVMSYRDVVDEIGDTLMLLSDDVNEFIQ